MSDTAEDEFDKAFEGFGEPPVQPAPPATDPATPPAEPPTPETPPVTLPPTEEPKKDDETPPAEPPKADEGTPPADPAKKPEEGAEPPKDPETPPAPEEPKPLTEESVKSIIQNIRTDERTSAKELETTTKEVLEAYYPEGLTNDLIYEATGKKLETPQDVVDATNGEMSIEEAANWLMNEQFKLDSQVNKIKADAEKIAETTINFKRDSVAALQKYEPLFKAYPTLQQKAFNLLMKQVQADKDHGVILVAPDVMDLYDTYLEPYQQAYEFSTKQPATNAPVAPGSPATPPAAPTPGAADRLDENGDGGTTVPDDPNDFAQQVKKELAKGA